MSESPEVQLRAEHDLHRRMLVVLERIAREVRGGLPFPAEDVAVVLTYFREFFERVHHAKEAELFYPAIVMLGGEDEAELVGELIGDHDETKFLLHSLSLFWEPGDLLPEEREGFADLVSAYGKRLRRQMEIEESRLFPLAAAIPADDRIDLLVELRACGAEHRPAAHWRAEAMRLEATYAA